MNSDDMTDHPFLLKNSTRILSKKTRSKHRHGQGEFSPAEFQHSALVHRDPGVVVFVRHSVLFVAFVFAFVESVIAPGGSIVLVAVFLFVA